MPSYSDFGDVVLDPVDEDVMVVTLVGEHDATTTEKLEGAFGSVGSQSVVVDLSIVEFIDSATLHALVKASAAVESNGGRFVVQIGPGSAVRKVMEITDLLEKWSSAPDRPSAVQLARERV